jgi:trk system potassium uptake protein TrkH
MLPDRQSGRDTAWGFFLGYLVLISAGFAALRLPGTMVRGNELNVDRAVFTVINAATLTGFQLNVGAGQFNPASPVGPAALLLLTVGGAVFSLAAGGLAVVRILRLPYTDGQVMSAATTATTISTLAGAAALLGGGRGLFDALLQSASAFGNSGLYSGPLNGTGAWQTHLILLPLALFGGLGLTVLMELYDWLIRRRPLSEHARIVLRLSAWIYIVGFVVLLGSRESFWSNLFAGIAQHGWYHRQSVAIRGAFVSSSALAINSRTAGFPFEFAGALPRATQWLVMVLMVIGANSAGTAGGVKVTTFVQIGRGIADALKGRRVSRAFGIAAVWLGGYFAIVALGFLTLLWQIPELPPDRLLFLSISAASNVGLSHDLISMVLSGLFTLSLVMLLGRIAPLLVLWWMAESTSDADIAVG